MTITAAVAKQCVDMALQGGDAMSVANWFTNPAAARQVADALNGCNFISRKQQVGVIIAHSTGSATPVNGDGANLPSLLGLIGALNAAALAQAANPANNSQTFDLVAALVTNVK